MSSARIHAPDLTGGTDWFNVPRPLSLAGLKGKVVLLDFWGTWCPPCVAAVPTLRNWSRRMENSPFVLVSISTDSDEPALRQFSPDIVILSLDVQAHQAKMELYGLPEAFES